MNAIPAVHPYRPEGLWVFDDETVGLRQEPFVAGADGILTGSPPKNGTGHLLARKRWILREADFTCKPFHKRGGYAHEHPECEPHGMPRRRRRLQVSHA